jgi:hypothetical protein
MDNLIIEATKSSPAIRFNSMERVLEITGESYPENAAKFYAPVFAWLESFLPTLEPGYQLVVNLTITYFNSSSSKALMNFLGALETAQIEGKSIVVNWYYDPDNDTALECGEEFMEDCCDLNFVLIPQET